MGNSNHFYQLFAEARHSDQFYELLFHKNKQFFKIDSQHKILNNQIGEDISFSDFIHKVSQRKKIKINYNDYKKISQSLYEMKSKEAKDDQTKKDNNQNQIKRSDKVQQGSQAYKLMPGYFQRLKQNNLKNQEGDTTEYDQSVDTYQQLLYEYCYSIMLRNLLKKLKNFFDIGSKIISEDLDKTLDQDMNEDIIKDCFRTGENQKKTCQIKKGFHQKLDKIMEKIKEFLKTKQQNKDEELECNQQQNSSLPTSLQIKKYIKKSKYKEISIQKQFKTEKLNKKTIQEIDNNYPDTNENTITNDNGIQKEQSIQYQNQYQIDENQLTTYQQPQLNLQEELQEYMFNQYYTFGNLNTNFDDNQEKYYETELLSQNQCQQRQDDCFKSTDFDFYEKYYETKLNSQNQCQQGQEDSSNKVYF